MGDMKFESNDESQMRAVGKVYGTAYLGDRYESHAPRSSFVSGVGGNPPNIDDWVDRARYQAELTDRLIRDHVTEIVAIGGFGKSSLAAWAYEHCKGQFQRRVWVDFRWGETFYRFAQHVLQEIDKPNQDPQATEATLLRDLLVRLRDVNVPVKTLVVMDNLESIATAEDWPWFERFLMGWRDEGRESRVLVTTRSRTLETRPIDLRGLSIAEGTVFFERSGLAGDRLAELVELAEGHPLLLKLAAAWVRQTYGARVDERAIDFFEKLFGQYKGDLTAKVEDIFETLFLALSDQLQELLLKISVYRLPVDLGMAQAMRSEVKIGDLEMLSGKGLLLKQDDRFVLHPLVEEFIRSRLSDTDRRVAHEAAIAFYEANYQEWDGTIDSCQEDLEVFFHACELGQYGRANSTLDRRWELLERRGYYRELLPLYERLVGEWVPEDRAEQQEWAWTITSLGSLCCSLGEYQRAIDFQQQALEIKRQIGDRNGEAASLGNLGNAYKSLGEYHRAIDFQQKSLEITRQIGDRNGEGKSLFNIGIVLANLNRYPEALQHFHQAQAIYTELQLDHMIEKCNNAIQTCNQTINKKRRNQRLRRFLFWFGIGITIVLLVWWLRK
jgi:tetratricopeptide (TPR) repeat protein